MKKTKKHLNQLGLTLIELLITMGIGLIIAGLASSNLIRPQSSSILTATADQLEADIRQVQLQSMIGRPGGIYLSPDSYVIFIGTSYNPQDARNTFVHLNPSLIVTTNLPNNILQFTPVIGEVVAFLSGQDQITLQHDQGQQRTYRINKLGIPIEIPQP